MSKNLIYFVVGGRLNYLKLTKLAINSIRKYTENNNLDILIICDEKFKDEIHNLNIKGEVDFLITDENEGIYDTIWRTFEVFNYTNIYDYEKILYLDSDVVVSGDLNPVFDEITENDCIHGTTDSDRWYCYYATNNIDTPYEMSKELIWDLFKSGYPAINSGHFGFKVTESNKERFEECHRLYDELRVYPENAKYGYDQPILNYVFTARKLVKYSLDRFVSVMYVNRKQLERSKLSLITHIAKRPNTPPHYKGNTMRNVIQYIRSNQII